MLWVYDNKIVEDLKMSFNSIEDSDPVVSVVPPEGIISIAAQVQDDKLHFPIVAVARNENIPIDNTLTNFTRMHKGVPTVFDSDKNELYYEKAVPIKLEYELVCLGTTTADVDELLRELMFKYTSQYFITIEVPYESKRNIRCGLRIDPSEEITWYSRSIDYLESGKVHSAGVKLHVDGAVLLTYTPVKLRRLAHEIEPVAKNSPDLPT